MNYIAEINNFNNWLIENPMNSSEQALWYKLMAYANQLGWKSEFSIANSRLCEDLKMTRQYLDKCRNTLINKGLISYKKGNGNICGIYHINSLSVDTVVAQEWHSSGTVVDTVVAQQLQVSLPLNKQNKTKLNNKKESVKEKHGEYSHVLLTPAEYEKLKVDYQNADELIKFLDEYIEMKGYKAKSHYLAIKKWVVDAVAERKAKSQQNNVTDRDKESERQIKMLQDKIAKGEL